MAVLADLERHLERIFERSTARLFRAHPQAVQLERRVERAMERARVSAGGRSTVPVRYRVRLQPDDLAAVAESAGGPEVLAGRLADAALAFARAHGYHLPDRPSVALVADPGVERGVIEVDPVGASARAVAGEDAHRADRGIVPDVPVVAGRPVAARVAEAVAGGDPGDDPRATDEPPAPGRAPVGDEAVAPGEPPAPDARTGGTPVDVAPAPVPVGPIGPVAIGRIPVELDDALENGAVASEPAPEPAAPGVPRGGIRGDGSSTLVFRRPAPVPTRAMLRIVGRDGDERTIEVDGTPLTLGRASDNGLVIADPRVSRHHARLQARHGTLVLTDLASTNGSRVNGVRVDECALGTGDRVLLGDTVLLVEQLPD